MGMMPEAHASLLRAQEQLARRRDQCRPSVEGERNPARELARSIGRTIPIIYGQRRARRRWPRCAGSSRVNENAKAPAFWNAYPELDHNEVCGWGQHGDVTRQIFTLVELRHGLEHERLARRAVAHAALIEEALAQVLTVEARGRGPGRAAARPHLRRRLGELLPRARQRRRPRPDRRHRPARGVARGVARWKCASEGAIRSARQKCVVHQGDG